MGTLIDVWTLVWYWAYGHDELSRRALSLLWGLFFTGLSLIVIGILIDRIGRSARKAELPPSEVTKTEAHIQTAAAANGHPGMQAAAMPNMAPPPPSGTMPATPAASPVQQAQYAPQPLRR